MASDDSCERPSFRVLLTEDNPVNQRVIGKMLEKLGCKPDIADNGERAVAAVMEQDYTLILMDIQMPVLDGLSATRRIRELLADRPRPRIVALTANALKEDEAACRAVGMDDFLTKPVQMSQLAKLIEAATSRTPAL